MVPAVTSTYPQFATHLVTNALNGCPLIDLFDDALADLLGLHSYAHGTSLRNYYGILWTGGQTAYGGRKDMGEATVFQAIGEKPRTGEDWDCRGKFYVATDTGHQFPECPCLSGIVDYPIFRMWPAAFSMATSGGEMYNAGCGVCSFAGPFFSFFSPTLKFRFRPDEVDHYARIDQLHGQNESPDAHIFYTDGSLPGMAAFTFQSITPDRIGLYGTLTHGLQGDILQRAQDDPMRFLRGLVKLVALVALTALVVSAVLAVGLAISDVVFFLALIVGRIALPLIFGNLWPTPDPASIAHAPLDPNYIQQDEELARQLAAQVFH